MDSITEDTQVPEKDLTKKPEPKGSRLSNLFSRLRKPNPFQDPKLQARIELISPSGGSLTNTQVIATSKEKTRELSNLDEVLIKHKLASIEEHLFDRIRGNKDASFDELYQVALELRDKFAPKLTEHQMALIKYDISCYLEDRKAAQLVSKEYGHNPYKLFKDLVGKDPEGRIELLMGTTFAYLRCHNPRDYLLFESRSFESNEEPTEIQKEIAERSIAVVLGKVSPNYEALREQGQKFQLVVENAKGSQFKGEREQFFAHEAEHLWLAIFRRAYQLYSAQKEGKEIPEELTLTGDEIFTNLTSEEFRDELADALKVNNSQEKQERVYQLFKDRASWLEEFAKDEILSDVMQGNLNTRKIYESLTRSEEDGGGYDLVPNWLQEELIKSWGEQFRSQQDILRDNMEIVFSLEYHHIIKKSLDAFEKLFANGFSRKEAVFNLIHEPLRDWPALADQLIESRFK